jgi:hypothetical protein
MTTDEKRKLGAGLCHLSPDDLNKALEIVAQDNPIFQTKAEEVDLDMDAQVMPFSFTFPSNSWVFSLLLLPVRTAITVQCGLFQKIKKKTCIYFRICIISLWVQSETTLWRLKFFVREALERQANLASGKDANAKRKREIASALSQTRSKRIKKEP